MSVRCELWRLEQWSWARQIDQPVVRWDLCGSIGVAIWVCVRAARCVFDLAWRQSGQRRDGSCRLGLSFSLSSQFLYVLPTLYSIGLSHLSIFLFFLFFHSFFHLDYWVYFFFFGICIFLKRFIWTGLMIYDFGRSLSYKVRGAQVFFFFLIWKLSY